MIHNYGDKYGKVKYAIVKDKQTKPFIFYGVKMTFTTKTVADNYFRKIRLDSISIGSKFKIITI